MSAFRGIFSQKNEKALFNKNRAFVNVHFLVARRQNHFNRTRTVSPIQQGTVMESPSFTLRMNASSFAG